MATKLKLEAENTRIDAEKAEMAIMPSLDRKKGGWITFPFLSGCIFGTGLGLSGATSNFLVYLIERYNVGSIDAAQIANIIAGTLSLAPVAGAIVADAFFGCYSVIAVSLAIQFLSLVLFTLTAVLKSLQPPTCEVPGAGSCQAASTGQLTVLYSAVALLTIATGGTRFNQATMGATQFEGAEDQAIFFNWFFIFMYSASIVGSTALVYIEDSVSWTLGFALSLGVTAMSFGLFILGTKYYQRLAPQGSPFTGLARVIVATARKWKVKLQPQMNPTYFHGNDHDIDIDMAAPSKSFSFLNRAALITEGDTNPDGTKAKQWKLCSVREVEDLKSIVGVVPLWTSSIFVSIAIGCQLNLSVLQALTMDRSMGPHLSFPAGSMPVPSLVGFVVFLTLLDRILFPIWRWLTHHTPTPLQRVGTGQFINAVSMVSSALVERRRAAVISRHEAENHPGWIVPMSALWLMLPLALAGAAEALHFPGQVEFYYQEFPKSLKNTSTGIMVVVIALGFYLSTALLGVVRRVTTWLPDDLNRSKLENVYWLIAVLAAINFLYYVACAKFYKYKNASASASDKASLTEMSAI